VEQTGLPTTEVTSNSVATTVVTPTTLTYNGPSGGDYHDAVSPQATLTDGSGSPVANETISFAIGSQGCSGVTGANGAASCSLLLGQASGSYTATAAFAGDGTHHASNASSGFVIAAEESTAVVTSAANDAASSSATLSGTLVEDSSGLPIAGRQLTLTLGGSSCVGTTGSNGSASCRVTTPGALGPASATAGFGGDAFYKASSAQKSVIVYGFATGGTFTIGDGSYAAAGPNTDFTFLSGGWTSLNNVSGGAPSSFKGFENDPTIPPCGSQFLTSPGNSTPPPATVPTYMAVIVTGSVSKNGSSIAGSTIHLVIIKVDAGYNASTGTGTVVGVIC
jgi:hypothetical protein